MMRQNYSTIFKIIRVLQGACRTKWFEIQKNSKNQSTNATNVVTCKQKVSRINCLFLGFVSSCVEWTLNSYLSVPLKVSPKCGSVIPTFQKSVLFGTHVEYIGVCVTEALRNCKDTNTNEAIFWAVLAG